MDLDILGVIKKNFFSLSNYSLSAQLLVVNIFIFFFGSIFLIFFNYYLINNDKLVDKKVSQSINELNEIKNFLEKNSIINIPLYQTNYRCRIIDKDDTLYREINCQNENLFINKLKLSGLELERFIVEQYIYNNYFNEEFNIKIFNDNWIQIADSNDQFLSTNVDESEIINNEPFRTNIFNLYEEKYYSLFNSIYYYILHNKYLTFSSKKTHDINIVSETIRKKIGIEKLYINKENKIIKVLSTPLIVDDRVYGVAILSFQLITNNNDLALNSINLLNFFIFLIFTIIILSFLFLRGLILPLNQLTKITVLEREKIRDTNYINYPIRSDEIGILAKQIQIMSNDLKSQVEQLEKFTSDVAHELKNPLTAIKSSSELLLKNTISEENKLKLIKNFNKEVDRMNILISDMSNFSRTISEIEMEKFEIININQFLTNFVKNYSGNKKNIKLKFNKLNKNLSVLVNENKLLQVILNLVENSVSIANRNTNILITTNINKNKNFVEVKLYDQGKGIKKQDREKIFQRFYSDRDKLREEHSGLGLSISREIIKSFNGSIESTKSDKIDFCGACFLIKLPLRTI